MEININDKKYFLFIEKNDKKITCMLYDGAESWIESSSLASILERGKDCNKRIKYDETTIMNTLQNATPLTVNWDEESCEQNEKYLKLKYSVQNHPLYFTWHFRKQAENEFQKFIMCTLLNLFEGLKKQNEELREVVVKKDIEIKQFRTEGAILKRVTVGTKPFNPSAFDEKYSETNSLSKSIGQITDLLCAQFGQQPSKQEETEDSGPSQHKNNQPCNDVKLTPRRKRRKMLDEQQRIIAEKLKARGKTLNYESSQSEPLSTSSPEVLDMNTTKKSLNLLEKEPDVDEVKEQSGLSPSASLRTRKEPIKNKPEEGPSLRKKTKIEYVEYDSTQSSTEDAEHSITNEKPVKISVVHSQSPLNTTNAHSTDIQSIIDEWKKLEQRRVDDLNNIRTTRNGKRINQ